MQLFVHQFYWCKEPAKYQFSTQNVLLVTSGMVVLASTFILFAANVMPIIFAQGLDVHFPLAIVQISGENASWVCSFIDG